MLKEIVGFAAVFVATIGLTALVRRNAIPMGLVDVPNARSSHSVATPRGGGSAIAIVALVALVVVATAGDLRSDATIWAICGSTAAVALVGFIDDLRGVSAISRTLVHIAAALPAVASIGGFPPIEIAGFSLGAGWWSVPIGTVAVVWFLNLFNFMDGIDGLAASQAIFISVAAAALIGATERAGAAHWALGTIAAASAGFLVWNWAPARIFMGDVGSGFLGMILALIAVWTARQGLLSIWTWLLLGSLFIADATSTLLIRIGRGERWAEAHRSHVYQRLASRWRSHAKVTLAYMGINVALVAPLAYIAQREPDKGGLIAVGFVGALMLLAIFLGAGRASQAASRGTT